MEWKKMKQLLSDFDFISPEFIVHGELNGKLKYEKS